MTLMVSTVHCDLIQVTRDLRNKRQISVYIDVAFVHDCAA